LKNKIASNEPTDAAKTQGINEMSATIDEM
jgi:hypothetical protein